MYIFMNKDAPDINLLAFFMKIFPGPSQWQVVLRKFGAGMLESIGCEEQ
tara:strand:+ start:403 stop:549 length:147 start_codon:yes stop_codon:yes gene_type:complete